MHATAEIITTMKTITVNADLIVIFAPITPIKPTVKFSHKTLQE